MLIFLTGKSNHDYVINLFGLALDLIVVNLRKTCSGSAKKETRSNPISS